MKTVCQQEKLHAGLTIVNRAAPTRSNIGVQQNVLIRTEENHLKMTANNNQISITTWVPAEIQSPGEVTIPARLLNYFINLLPKEEITIEDITTNGVTPSDEGHLVKIDCGKSKTHIHGTSGELFPETPELEEPTTILINAEEFRAAIDMVAFCAASEESRPVLTGVEMLLDGQEFTMTATDGFRLAQKKGRLEGEVEEPVSIIIPTKSLAEFNHIRSDSAQPVRMTVSKNLKNVLFETRTAPPTEYRVEMTSHLMAGSFPQYGQLIPKDHTTRAVFEIKNLIMAIRSAAVFAKDGNNTIRFQMKVNQNANHRNLNEGPAGDENINDQNDGEEDPGNLNPGDENLNDQNADDKNPGKETPGDQNAGDPNPGGRNPRDPGSVVIIGKSEDVGDNSAVVDAIEMSGDDLLIGFNNKYIMEALNSIDGNDSSRVIIHMQTSSSPGVLKTDESGEYTHIIMPMFIKEDLDEKDK